MKKICIIGHFGGNENFYDGQTIKTKNVYLALLDIYNEEELDKIDTYKWKKYPVRFLKECINGIKNSKNLIILPANNGVKVFVPLFLLMNKLYKRKIFYVVIGGWLPNMLKNKKILSNLIKKLDSIFVETTQMKESLSKLGIYNVKVMQNFKKIEILKQKELKTNIDLPLKLCTFSRVCKEKGIEDAIEVIKRINLKYSYEICTLDIYGQIDTNYKNTFDKLINQMPKYIKYKGVVEYNRSVETIKQYDLLLFPTFYEGEGIAGTLIDAMCSGVPAIASDWKYNCEIIKNGINGYLYEVHNNEQLQNRIEKMIKDTNQIVEIGKSCIIEAEKYKTQNVIKILLDEIENPV